jgi:hypothetical protein
MSSLSAKSRREARVVHEAVSVPLEGGDDWKRLRDAPCKGNERTLVVQVRKAHSQKSYMRLFEDGRICWLLVTSANISKSAWGYFRGSSFHIPSYELGVLLTPDTFGVGTLIPLLFFVR